MQYGPVARTRHFRRERGARIRAALFENFGVLTACSRVVSYGPQSVLVLLSVFLDFLQCHRQRLVQCVRHILRRQCQYKRRLIIVRRAIPQAEDSILHALCGDEPEWLRHGLYPALGGGFGRTWPNAPSLVSALVNSRRTGPRESIPAVRFARKDGPGQRLARARPQPLNAKYPCRWRLFSYFSGLSASRSCRPRPRRAAMIGA